MRRSLVQNLSAVAAALILAASGVSASEPVANSQDWPNWRGPAGDGRLIGVDVPESWPEEGLKQIWRREIGGGYAAIAVAGERVITQDRQTAPDEVERVLCVDAATGAPLWTHTDPVQYDKLDYGNGPRACPTIVRERVYTLGALGQVNCLSLADGKVLWQRHLQNDFQGRMPTWGYAASPLIIGDWVIVQPGGLDGWSIVALDARSGEVVWNSLSDEAGYTWPIVIRSGGLEQLICWTPSHVRGLELATGRPLWQIPYEITYGVAIATPIFHEGIVVVSGYWHGSKAIRLGEQPESATLLWEENRYLRGLMSQALYRDGLVYLLDKQYGVTCFELETGTKLWDDKNTMTPRGRNPQASLVWIGDSDRVLALNADGDLVQTRLTRERPIELARSKVIGETWAHPAYSGKRVFARSDTELVCVELP